MFGGPGGTGYDGVRFPAHSGWDSRDVIVAGMYDFVKEYEFCNVIDHLVRCGLLFVMVVCLILFGGV